MALANFFSAAEARSFGFAKYAESTHIIQGLPIEFIDMEMTEEAFDNKGMEGSH